MNTKLSSLLTYIWFASCVVTSAFRAPSTFEDLLSVLCQLGYNHAKELPKQTNLSYAVTHGSTNDQCLKTVTTPLFNWKVILLMLQTIKCGILAYVLADIVNTPGRISYIEQQSAYWSTQQTETLPACRVQPKQKNDVAAALIVTSFFKCPFAVKSGGHGAFAGASNIQDGLTIDLNNLKTIYISSDRTTTQVGAGNRWVDVYSALVPLNLAVIGGRVADIGVGGLTLGGDYF